MWGSIISEWASLLLRWLHVVAAIAWIGSSFYFIALDLSLKPKSDLPGDLPDGVQGEAWQVHGGGFYRIMKYLVAPTQMPDDLTWFKWEAYTTWLSGFALMVVVYYLEADLFLVDKSILDLTPFQAGLFSFFSLALAWALYEAACRSGLAQRELPFAIGGYLFLVALTYAFTHVLSGRGAFNQIAAIIGTIMVANVFTLIIPNQKKIVAALIAGQAPDPKLGKTSKERSVHNNYLTLPVVVLMISNHYPLLYATRFNWIIVAIILALGPVIAPLLQRAPCRAPIAVVGVGRGRRGRDRDPLPVRRRPARGEDRRAVDAGHGRQCRGDRDVPLQHVPCGRAGLGRHRHCAEGHPARRARAHPSQHPPDRTRRGLVHRDAARQHHRNDQRGACHPRRLYRAGALTPSRVDIAFGGMKFPHVPLN
ncbi:hypothetical protein ACVI3S_006019 [Bradyrhizobium diazoefficiens]